MLVTSIFCISHNAFYPSQSKFQCYSYIYTEPQKKHCNFNNSIRYGKQSIYFFSLNYKFLLQHKVLVLVTKSKATINYAAPEFHCINVKRIENFIFFFVQCFFCSSVYFVVCKCFHFKAV